MTRNEMSGVESVRVIDDGHGISYARAIESFGSLGNSWKSGTRSPKGRRLHGHAGEGRFSAFCLGNRVRWRTRFEEPPGHTYEFEIRGSSDRPGVFQLSDSEAIESGRPGTDVHINQLTESTRQIATGRSVIRLTELFALYLRQYPDVEIIFDGTPVDPAIVQEQTSDYFLAPIQAADGTLYELSLTIIEWKHAAERELHLCDSAGFSLSALKPGVQAPGFNFTGYLKSDYFEIRQDRGGLDLSEIDPVLSKCIDAAKSQIRSHFRAKSAEQARGVVQRWKDEHIYPFEGPPRDALDSVERQVFDVVALNINEYLPGFAQSDSTSQKWSLHMLKAAIEKSPNEARRIIQDVLSLPIEKQEELAELLEKTTLSAIINASKLVADRLDLLAGLEVLLFDPETKGKIKERKHLHRILAENTWIFGEEFNLSVDDERDRSCPLSKNLPV